LWSDSASIHKESRPNGRLVGFWRRNGPPLLASDGLGPHSKSREFGLGFGTAAADPDRSPAPPQRGGWLGSARLEAVAGRVPYRQVWGDDLAPRSVPAVPRRMVSSSAEIIVSCLAGPPSTNRARMAPDGADLVDRSPGRGYSSRPGRPLTAEGGQYPPAPWTDNLDCGPSGLCPQGHPSSCQLPPNRNPQSPGTFDIAV